MPSASLSVPAEHWGAGVLFLACTWIRTLPGVAPSIHLTIVKMLALPRSILEPEATVVPPLETAGVPVRGCLSPVQQPRSMSRSSRQLLVFLSLWLPTGGAGGLLTPVPWKVTICPPATVVHAIGLLQLHSTWPLPRISCCAPPRRGPSIAAPARARSRASTPPASRVVAAAGCGCPGQGRRQNTLHIISPGRQSPE